MKWCFENIILLLQLESCFVFEIWPCVSYAKINKKTPSVISGDHLGQGFVFMYLNLSPLSLKRMRKISILREVPSLLPTKDVGILVGNNFSPKKKIQLSRHIIWMVQPQTGHISSYLYISLAFPPSAFPPDHDHHVHVDPHGSGLHTSKATA